MTTLVVATVVGVLVVVRLALTPIKGDYIPDIGPQIIAVMLCVALMLLWFGYAVGRGWL